MNAERDTQIRMIPLDKITVVNPRDRGRTKFKQISNNIARLGLKKPITVTPKSSRPGASDEYFLVCGQGRFEAFQVLGQTEIPAFVVHVSKEKLMLMSLVENLARRVPSSSELVKEIASLKDRGYSFSEIAKKTDLDVTYVRGIVKLIKNGEERLTMAVERGQIPLSVAITIATSQDHEVQRALTEAYEANDLRGKKLLAVRRIIEQRKANGKTVRSGVQHSKRSELEAKELLQTYHKESARQRLIIQRSKFYETQLMFVVSAIKQLLKDTNFVTLLRAESLNSMPAQLAKRVNEEPISND